MEREGNVTNPDGTCQMMRTILPVSFLHLSFRVSRVGSLMYGSSGVAFNRSLGKLQSIRGWVSGSLGCESDCGSPASAQVLLSALPSLITEKTEIYFNNEKVERKLEKQKTANEKGAYL